MKEKEEKNAKRITILDDENHRVPFSKGLTANAIMSSGLAPGTAYLVAAEIEELLVREGRLEVKARELRNIIYETLLKRAGKKYAENYSRYISFSSLNKPLVVLIGGSTGVGKSTIATMIANRLSIVRIVSTDAIREVMRAFFSRELMPTIHTSSFDADTALIHPLPPHVDPVVAGFREQSLSVLVGVRAIIKRALNEGTHIIIEGAHIVPGFIAPEQFPEAFIVPLVIKVSDEKMHRDHLYVRGVETQGTRPFMRYIKYFENIRKIQDYILYMSEITGVRTVECVDLDTTVSEVVEYIINAAYDMARREKLLVEAGNPT
ncbi:ATP cone domain-containing protein [Candidatus Solincola tengchongensis]|uniref:ATP cone domain-containing protein n=1 Tax=Candidatus Solincola tengchongensis TaxID=2900693 RepID=UPI0025810074|nr:ATP cone domain-containing protein [Candidatus Solincola tengchongensis]